jgi:flagellar biosynthesis/type III secretory pathway protein FliH
MIAWYKRAQKSAKIIGDDDAVDEMSPEELEPMFSERIEKWTEELRAEGEARGKAEGKAELLLSMFEMKFGSLSDEARARIESASAEEILRMSARLLTSVTPADVFLLD